MTVLSFSIWDTLSDSHARINQLASIYQELEFLPVVLPCTLHVEFKMRLLALDY